MLDGYYHGNAWSLIIPQWELRAVNKWSFPPEGTDGVALVRHFRHCVRSFWSVTSVAWVAFLSFAGRILLLQIDLLRRRAGARIHRLRGVHWNRKGNITFWIYWWHQFVARFCSVPKFSYRWQTKIHMKSVAAYYLKSTRTRPTLQMELLSWN